MKAKHFSILALLIAIVGLAGQAWALAAGTIFNVKDFGAKGDGRTDDTKAIQSAVNAAMKAGPGNTVRIPAGTFLVASGPLDIEHSQGLTLTGAGVNKTMIWYTRANAHFCNAWHNVDFTLENLSSDCQRLPDGKYDLGETQGTVTAVDTAAKQITVRIENGYPLLSRPDMENAPNMIGNINSNPGWSSPLYTLSDPNRADFDGNQPKMLKVVPSADGMTGVITLQNIPQPLYVGEKWMIWRGPGPIWLDLGYGDDGTTTLRNLHYYGGADNYAMGDVSGSGKLIFDHLYCGAPAYQPDRMLTCDEGWQGGGRYAFTVTDSTFLKTWDDVFDFGCGDTTALSQPAPNQVIVSGTGDYRIGDLTEFADDNGPQKGSYDKAQITAAAQVGGNTQIMLSQNVTLRNPGKDRFCDVSQAGPITAANSTFECANERHVYWRSGYGVTAANCKFINVPLVMGGWDGSEVPGDVTHIRVTGCTFVNSVGLIVWVNGGADNTPCGSDVVISGNHFYSSGRVAPGGGSDSYYGEGEPLSVSNVTHVVLTNNTFDDNWGVNTALRYDANVTLSGNVYRHPNEIHPDWANHTPDDEAVAWMADVQGVKISGNIVLSPGPNTRALLEQGPGDTDIVGAAQGIVAPAGKAASNVVSAAGRRSNAAWAAPNADYVPVNLAAAYMVAGINPAGWTYPGPAERDVPLPGRPAGQVVQWNGGVFLIGNGTGPDAVCDHGQRILLPAGTYRRLLLLGDDIGGAGSAQTLRVTITYADGSWTTLPLHMTNVRATSLPGLWGCSLALDSSKAAGWLTLPDTGALRLFAADLVGAGRSTLSAGQFHSGDQPH